MDLATFIAVLAQTRRQYKWTLTADGCLRAKARNHFKPAYDGASNIYCPLTAVARFLHKGNHSHGSFASAGKKLGIPSENLAEVVSTADNRFCTSFKAKALQLLLRQACGIKVA